MTGKKNILAILLLLFVAMGVQAARVDTVMVRSEAMNTEVKVVYVVPDKAAGNCGQACPVIYLLHGHGGNAKSWITIKPELPRIADEKGIIFVCPDGKIFFRKVFSVQYGIRLFPAKRSGKALFSVRKRAGDRADFSGGMQ